LKEDGGYTVVPASIYRDDYVFIICRRKCHLELTRTIIDLIDVRFQRQQHAHIDINIWAKETDNPIEVDATACPKNL
jgi:hypothetical protein